LKKSLAYPYLAWMVFFIVAPLILILYYSFIVSSDGTNILSLDNYRKVLNPTYLKIITNSVYLAFVSTIICFILGYPVAYIMSEKGFNAKSSLLFLFLVPMWMNFLLRTYSWLTILETNGILNSIISFMGLKKINILYTNNAVVLGMVYNFLPFMILPIYTVLKKIDYSYIEAAQDLGANSITVFLKIVFPLSLPGVSSGLMMVFLPAITTFVISDLLGGGKVMLVGNVIERQFLLIYDPYFGSALSIVLLVITLISGKVISLISKTD
jgi:spermidine/putrescine transport system permease protein